MRRISRIEHIEDAVTQEGFSVCSFLESSEIDELNQSVRELGYGVPGSDKFRISVTGETPQTRARIFDVFQPIFQAAVDRILEEYKIVRIAIFEKCPGGHRIQLHAHSNLVDESKYRSLAIWLPVSDTTVKMGTLHMVGRSHRLCGHIRSYDDFDFAFRDLSMRKVKRYSTPLSLSAGQAVVFDDRCLHWSPPNKSQKVRTAFQLELIPSEADLTIYYRSSDEELEKYALDELTYRTVSMTTDRPKGLTSLGTVRQPKVSFNNRTFVSMMERLRS